MSRTLRYFEEQVCTASRQRRQVPNFAGRGHVTRMCEDKIPKTVFYGELAEGRRSVSDKKFKYKDVSKSYVKFIIIDIDGWEELPADRTKWRTALRRGQKITDASNQRHYRGHNPGTHSSQK